MRIEDPPRAFRPAMTAVRQKFGLAAIVGEFGEEEPFSIPHLALVAAQDFCRAFGIRITQSVSSMGNSADIRCSGNGKVSALVAADFGPIMCGY